MKIGGLTLGFNHGSTKMKTIGTLEEIGAQVGDVVSHTDGIIHTANTILFDHPISTLTNWRIVTRAAKSPVRTVTRKEIVPGVYGKVTVTKSMSAFGCCGVQIYDDMTSSDLTAAIATLTEIRDAMAGDE